MSSAAGKKLTAVLALLVAAGGVGYLALGKLEDNLVYYWTASDLLENAEQVGGATIRLGGMVQKGSVKWDAEALRLRFSMGDAPEPEGASVVVISEGAPPQMFREGMGCIVEGTFDGKVFHSDRLMVKHSNEYEPPEHGDDPRDKYRTLIPEPGPSPAGRERAL